MVKFCRSIKIQTKPKYFDIPVLENISKEKFKELSKGLDYPLILRNYLDIKKWEIFNWDLEKISRELGDKEVSPRLNFPHPDNCEVNLFTMTSQEYPQKKTMKIIELVHLVKKSDAVNSPCYLQPSAESKKILEEINSRGKAVNFQDIVSSEENSPTPTENLYIGSVGTRAGFHQDYRDNLIVIIEGKKSVHLCAPYYTSCLYPFYGLPDKSKVRPETFEPKKFPKMSGATFLKGMLEQGDILFIPRGWWHTLRAFEPTVMLNYFYGIRLTKEELEFMYKPMGLTYGIGVKLVFIWLFLKTIWNLFLKRDPLYGLSVWYSPGTQAAINIYNSTRIFSHKIKIKLFRKKIIEFKPIQWPFYYN